MARQHLLLRNRKLIVASGLIGLGLLILFRNVAEATTLVRSLRIIGHEVDSLGILSAGAIAARRTLQAYLFDHTEFLQTVYQVLISFAAVLLIVTGTLFLPPCARWERKDLRKKRRHVDFAAFPSTYRWKQDSADKRAIGSLIVD